jgi:Pregnancy-associated plasma protein-A
MGLFHTYQNGCNSDNDGIADTPAHAGGSDSNCVNTNLDTCPTLPGKDPVNNYMNFIPDSCAKEFTRDQLLAMRANWFIYRAPIAAPPAPVPVPAPVKAPVKSVPAAVPVAVPVGVMMMMKMMMN